jgi:hypothetical protein
VNCIIWKGKFVASTAKYLNFTNLSQEGCMRSMQYSNLEFGDFLGICLKTEGNQEFLYPDGQMKDLPDIYLSSQKSASSQRFPKHLCY